MKKWRLALASFIAIAPAAFADDQANVFFERKIRPILVEYCHSCHSSKLAEPKSALRLDYREAALKGGARGPAILPGKPDKSRLIQAVSYADVHLQMPPKGKLPASAIADLTKWVEMGAPWPGGDAVAGPPKPAFDLAKRKAEHWAWQPVKQPAVPPVRNATWPAGPVDRFILAKLEGAGLTPAAPADPQVWLRRVYFDLTGLPPTPQDIADFQNSALRAPHSALEQVVDRLLASTRYGERWARHWLDLVRYAESFGHEFDPIIPNAYQYRDYVIRAFNADVPYNQFVKEHIAGDLLPNPRMNPAGDFNESILGTGHWFLGEQVHSPVDIRGDEADRIDNKIDVFGKTFLGLTISCARCHDHKFDAISQKDYYALSGFILSSSYRQVRFDSIEHNKRIAKELAELRRKHWVDIAKSIGNSYATAVSDLRQKLEAASRGFHKPAANQTDEDRKWTVILKQALSEPENHFHVLATVLSNSPENLLEIQRANRRSLDKSISERTKHDTGNRTIVAIGRENIFRSWVFDDSTYRLSFSDGTSRWSPLHGNPSVAIRFGNLVEYDSFWQILKLSPGTEKDVGGLGSVPRYGHTVLTPEFELRHGKVQVLLRGKCRIYASVDSHSLISGPLHGKLVQDFDTKEKWKWVTVDLTSYKGSHCHLELTPLASNLELDEVQEGPHAPPALSGTWLKLTGTRNARTVTEEINDLCKSMETVIRDMRNGELDIGGSVSAEIANLMCQHQQLLGARDFGDVRAKVDEYLKEEKSLARQLRVESRLAPAMIDVSAFDDRMHLRGSHRVLGAVVPRRFLEVLAGNSLPGTNGGSGRDILADQVTNPAVNPFIARVIVNRVWHHLFGRGIVASVDNFGVMGDRPTHPELLDYLADQFVKNGWSIKRLIRELVLSATYGQSSSHPSEIEHQQSRDPENLLLHKARLRRLQGEAIRDSILTVSGGLNEKSYGPSVPIHLTEFLDGRGKGASGPIDGNGRRSVYLAVKRNFLSPFMLTFDTPAPFSTMGRRSVSNVPAQALILMNDPFVHQQAERWGTRVRNQPGTDAERIRGMYLSAFARLPNADEEKRMLDFVSKGGTAWTDLAHVLINMKEFIWLP